MNPLNRLFLLFYTISVLGATSHCFSQSMVQYDTQIILSSDKTEYQQSEYIFIEYNVINHQTDGPYLSKNVFENTLLVKGSNGDIFEPRRHVALEDQERMIAEKSFSGKINLLRWYQMSTDNSFPESLFPPGNYIVQYVYANEENVVLKSNVFEFSIIKPNTSDLDAFNLYKRAMNQFQMIDISNNLTRNIELTDIDSLFGELIVKYPSTCYAEQGLYNRTIFSIFYSDSVNIIKIVNHSKSFLEKHPDSPLIGKMNNIVRGYYKNKNDKVSARKYYSKLNKETKSRKMKRITDKIIDDIDNDQL